MSKPWLIAFAIVLAAPRVQADEPEQSNTHFRTGVAFYREHNRLGALAEFEEAYRLRPTASALQNVALCQKELYRYVEAVTTLERMLREYGQTLSAQDRKAAQDAIDQMRPLVASVVFVVSPPEATVAIDERTLKGGAERPMELNPGEYRIVAEAPNHRRLDQKLMIAAVQGRKIPIALTGISTLSIRTQEPDAEILVDTKVRGKGAWSGEVTAEERHKVQISKAGSLSQVVEVALAPGEKKEIVEAQSGSVAAVPAPYPDLLLPYTPRPHKRGFYGLFSLTGYVLMTDPNFVQASASTSRSGGFVGVRAGYRIANPIGVELSAEVGKNSVGPVCYRAPAIACGGVESGQNYSLASRRFGVNGRFFSNGHEVQFLAALGVGLVHHTIDLPSLIGAPSSTPSGQTSAVDGYLMLEGGGQISFTKWLFQAVLVLDADSTGNLKLGDATPYDKKAVTSVGIAIRVGYGQW